MISPSSEGGRKKPQRRRFGSDRPIEELLPPIVTEAPEAEPELSTVEVRSSPTAAGDHHHHHHCDEVRDSRSGASVPLTSSRAGTNDIDVEERWRSGEGQKDHNLNLPPEMCCPVCLEAFASPVTLQCNHNVCHEHILDLAAAATPSGVLSDPQHSAICVPCPKCRSVTTFEHGLRSIHVNLEMSAIVEMMVSMLQKIHSNPAGASPPAGRSSKPPRPPGSGGPRVRAVRFQEEGDTYDGDEGANNNNNNDDDREVDVIPKSNLKKHCGGAQTPERPDLLSNDRDVHRSPQRALPALNTPRELDRKLQEEREKLREERERQQQQKLEQYKKARKEEIEKRKVEEALALAALHRGETLEGHAPDGGAELLPPDEPTRENHSPLPQQRTAPSGTSESPSRASRTRQQIIDAIRLQEELRLRRLEEQEQNTQIHVREWLSEGEELAKERIRPSTHDGAVRGNHHRLGDSSTNTVSASSEDIVNHMRRLESFLAGGGVNGLTNSTKARRAEERIMHLYKPPVLKSAQQRAEELEQERAERAKTEQRDEEVERRLWEVERDVLRQHDHELSRAQMAEIAELRARQQIAQFRKQHNAPPAKPSYKPKLDRLQKFP